MQGKNRKISVVIPAYNCRAQLLRLLDNLSHQTLPASEYEILVVDDGSNDGSCEGVEERGIRVVRHPENRGRVMARESGAKAATYETLMFVDARVILEPEVMANALKLDYLPLMGVGAADKRLGSVDRLFYCIRRRVYWPYEPQFKYGKELWLKADAFDGRPKGTGLLFIDRAMFLDCALEDKCQDVNDDTRLLYNIVCKGAPILRHTDLVFHYEHRKEWKELMRHTYYRGPKFFDYYLSPGGPLFYKYCMGWVLVAGYLLAAILWPMLMWLIPGVMLLLLLAGSIWISEEIGDIPVCILLFPCIASAFGLGIITAQLARILGLRHLIRH